MKKIVCELCEGTEFAKEGGMFVCQGCGTKYTPDEAKAMMKEVEGGAAPAPAVNPNHQQIDNLLILATNAFESSNNEETEGYCNKIIELDVTCYRAWLLKGQAIGWQSTYGSPRVIEGANALRKAVDFAPEEKKENVAILSINVICQICDALCSLAKENFGQNPVRDNRFKFGEFCDLCAKATNLFDNVSQAVKEYSFEQWKAHKRENAKLMNMAGVAALNFIREKWNDIEYPNTNSLSTYLDWIEQVEFAFKDSITFGESVDEEDDAIITRYENRIIAIEEPINACSWKQVWQSWSSSYVWQKDQSLTEAAKQYRRKQVNECKSAIKKIENKAKEKAAAEKKAAKEAKKARIAAYWEAHKEEKDKLESEKKDLKNKQKDINAQIANLDKQIKAAEAEEKAKVPSEAEEDKLHEQVRELNNRRANLGIFAGKEKKQIAEEIVAIEGRISAVKAKVREEKKAKSDEVKAKVAPLKTKKDELNKELPAIKKRISAIDAELSKDPEE